MGRYSNLNTKRTESGVEYLSTPRYPIIPKKSDDIYIITTAGDRLDLLAYNFYKDTQYWWIIAAANPGISVDSLYLKPGLQLRIPAGTVETLSAYNNINKEVSKT